MRLPRFLGELSGNRFAGRLVIIGVVFFAFEYWLEAGLREYINPEAFALFNALAIGILISVALLFLLRGSIRREGDALDSTRASEERFRGLTSLSADWFWETDAAHRVTWLAGGSTAAALLGSESAYGRRLLELSGIEVPAPSRGIYMRSLDSRVAFRDVEISRRVVGDARVVHLLSGEPLFDLKGEFLGFRGVGRDVTEQRRARDEILVREKRFRDVVDAAGEFVWETDLEWRYTYLSARVESALGYAPAELIGRMPRELLAPGEAPATALGGDAHGRVTEPFRDLQYRAVTKHGRQIWLSVNGMPVRDREGRVQGFRGTGTDITARKESEERIEYLATRDALTGLPNRNLLNDRANQAILVAARSRGLLALLTLGIDRLDLVSDSLGHRAGDALLRAVSERLAGTLRREDSLARLDGGEFGLLWTGLKSTEDAAVLAQRIADTLTRPFSVENRVLNVTVSTGIAIYPNDGADFASLLRNANAALHAAKEHGRGEFRFSSASLNARAMERLAVENDLRRALARNELLLHWQPVVRTRHGESYEVVGAEALVRWQHPQRGLLMPDAFVPLAEECGLIASLGDWTMQRALARAGAWQRSLPGKPWFAINVSAAELAQGHAYATRLREALAAHKLEGDRIELEVTERVLMSNFAANLETLREIGESGVRIAIDDFGTGYSSLAYLRRLPVDKLKIDRAFLRELDSHPNDETIVRTIASMARALGLSVAAEGVETQAQLETLLALGCEEWQGHYYSLPLDAEAFERLLLGPARAVS
jgi:diguanylate cyclase (GGDEF)-like protein/PAS domain S-box-containing protein